MDPNFNPNAGYGSSGGDFTGGMEFDMGDLGDILGGIFGGGFSGAGRASGRAASNAPWRGESLRASVSVSFEEAAFGCEKDLRIERIEPCADCHGTGCAAGSSPETCPDCGGSGVIQQRRQTAIGFMSSTVPCPRCGGTGKIIRQPCSICKGKGAVRKRKTIKVRIPAGIDDGQAVMLRGQGNAGKNGGPAGDLQVVVNVRPHMFFRREGSNVRYDAHISFAQAALGAEIEVPTIDGRVKYKIPAGTQSHSTFRLQAKGIPGLNGAPRGDEYVTVHVEIPHNLSREQIEALQKFDATLKSANYTVFKGRAG